MSSGDAAVFGAFGPPPAGPKPTLSGKDTTCPVPGDASQRPGVMNESPPAPARADDDEGWYQVEDASSEGTCAETPLSGHEPKVDARAHKVARIQAATDDAPQQEEAAEVTTQEQPRKKVTAGERKRRYKRNRAIREARLREEEQRIVAEREAEEERVRKEARRKTEEQDRVAKAKAAEQQAAKEREDFEKLVVTNLFLLSPDHVDDDSAFRREWLRQKKENNEKNKYLDLLMTMVGIEEVKARVLGVKASIEAAARRKEPLFDLDRLKLTVVGKSGTGKSAVLLLYTKIIESLTCAGELTTEIHSAEPPPAHSSSAVNTPLQLSDHSDDQLLELLIRMMDKKGLSVPGGNGDPCLHVLVARASRGRESDDYRNVHQLRDEFNLALDRQALRRRDEMRLARDNAAKLDRMLTREDILGPQPPAFRDGNASYAQLQRLSGLSRVKEEVEELIDLVKANQDLERRGEEPERRYLNRLFLSPPGTGKTTVAKLYGRIIADLGLVSRRDVVFAQISDLIHTNIGKTEQNMAELLVRAQGKVLLIDDAQILGLRDPDDKDDLRGQIVGTIVSKVSGSPDEDRCVILVGYKEAVEDVLRTSDPGFQRRIPIEDALVFDGYSDDELLDIMDIRMRRDGFEATANGRNAARNVLARMRGRPNFGNAADAESLASRAQARWREDRRALPKDQAATFERLLTTGKVEAVFEDFVGYEKIIKQFQGYHNMTLGMRKHNVDPRPHTPWAFVFKGPPGTGKTSTAKKIGRIYYDMGFLSTDEVVACSVTDMIGQYKGHTGPKVLGLLDKAIGKVLFIDEAYRLAHDGESFQNEAVGELIDAMTKPRYARNMVIVLAGYTGDIERLMGTNPGLRSRFPTHLKFPHLDPENCLAHFRAQLSRLGIQIPPRSFTMGPSADSEMLDLFGRLAETPGWANERDVETLATNITMAVVDEVLGALREMLRDRGGEVPEQEEQEGGMQLSFSFADVSKPPEGLFFS
ncbi:stage V sporulation protein K [Colletotrichum sojae]|uniref:Stage V sporulation protein K n=1 Tax=Colletotrichum sojae TaxID=2175907 RepID=A0A8H6J0J1_9PEZI|nr:stage V sporulation protein K [Colletotrichum sojae]